jgi:hypothetical protein
MLARQFLTNAANGIPLSIWYDWRDDGVDPNDPEHHFGLVRNQYQAGRIPVYELKPAYLAASAFLRNLAGYRFEQRLMVGSDSDYVLIFAKDNERRIAAWTTATDSHAVTIPSGDAELMITNLKGEVTGRLRASQGKLSISLTSAPVYLAPAN